MNLNVIKAIEVRPGPSEEVPVSVTAYFHVSDFDLAVAFARWLGEQSGVKPNVFTAHIQPVQDLTSTRKARS